ncbi:3-phosphoshikimate 1-carboxyvinyltransferase [Vulgatibacter sp.]|uniref:3-phosphoshikimate 1-carboxyvinyltransferase n=1 Tax=Vulgatibacter sp. TaxID=1971226 RepID=UPI003565011E
MDAIVRAAAGMEGEATVPGDKSISHRALIFAALAQGRCRIEGLSTGADVRSTASCLRQLGVRIDADGTVHGVGLHGLRAPEAPLDCGNSGTTMRLLAGVLAGSGVGGTLDGDESLRRRPMARVIDPLRAMGAACETTDGRAPLHFAPGRPLHGVDHVLPIASAQVKSALLLAGLWAKGTTSVREPSLSRDHTERMLAAFGASITKTTIHRTDSLRAPATLHVPGDPSSAAFLLGAALLVPGGSVTVRHVDGNPTRTGLLDVLDRMGARITRTPRGEAAGDPVIDCTARHGGTLHATVVEPHEIPALVDEVPLLAALATQAHGTTEIRGAGELRVKESDRLAAIAAGLTALGADIEEQEDGLRIHGPTPLRGATVDSHGDHRIAMSLAVAGLIASGETTIRGAEWVDISFPGFFSLLGGLCRGAVRLRG